MIAKAQIAQFFDISQTVKSLTDQLDKEFKATKDARSSQLSQSNYQSAFHISLQQLFQSKTIDRVVKIKTEQQ